MYNGSIFIERKILRVPILGGSFRYMRAFAMPLTLAFDRQVLVVVFWDGVGAAAKVVELVNPLKGTFFYVHLRDIGPQVNALEHWIPIFSVLMFFMYCNVQ